MLGLFYVYGDGVPKEPATGAKLVKTAAVNGSDVAMYYLGNFYATGVGVDKDPAAAPHWMREAKKAGFPVEQKLLTEEGIKTLR